MIKGSHLLARECLLALLIGILLPVGLAYDLDPTFTIANDTFLRDGRPTQILSGSFHYARAPPALWRDRLQRLRALGLNAVQTYVPWNWHEATEG